LEGVASRAEEALKVGIWIFGWGMGGLFVVLKYQNEFVSLS
jgi:hypothetical protein